MQAFQGKVLILFFKVKVSAERFKTIYFGYSEGEGRPLWERSLKI